MIPQVNIRFNAGVEYKGYIYLSSLHINGLFRLDMMTQELSYIKRFEKEFSPYSIHQAAFLYGNEAWFIPMRGCYIAVVNLDTLTISYLDPPFHKTNPAAVDKPLYGFGGVIEGRYLYMVPIKLDTLLVVDLKTKQLYPYYEIVSEKEFFVHGAYYRGKLYMPPIVGNYLLELNLQTGEKKRHRWDFPDRAFSGIICEDNKLWFVPMQSNFFFSVDLITEQVEQFELENYYDKEFVYRHAVRYGDMLYFTPDCSDKILKFNMVTKELFECRFDAGLLENGKNSFRKIYSPNRLILVTQWVSTILFYDEENGVFDKIELCMDRDVLLQEMMAACNGDIGVLKEFKRDGIWSEECLTLEKFMQIKPESRKEDIWQNCTGNKVWNELKNQIVSL